MIYRLSCPLYKWHFNCTNFKFLATASSSYYFWSGYWGPQFAINQQTSYWNVYFFHSHYEPYPWIKIVLSAAQNPLTNIRIQTRCDANQWWHYQDIETRVKTSDITTGSGAVITDGVLCNNFQYVYWWQCGHLLHTCGTPVGAYTHVTLQQKTLDSDGGGWGQHSSTAAYFLMLNEVEFY